MTMYKLVILFLFYSVLIPSEDKDQKIQPSITDITESVYSSVTIQPDGKIIISFSKN